MKHIRIDMNINSIVLPIVLYIVRFQMFIVSCHFLEWKLSFPGEGTGVPFKGNWRFLRGKLTLAPYDTDA